MSNSKNHFSFNDQQQFAEWVQDDGMFDDTFLLSAEHFADTSIQLDLGLVDRGRAGEDPRQRFLQPIRVLKFRLTVNAAKAIDQATNFPTSFIQSFDLRTGELGIHLETDEYEIEAVGRELVIDIFESVDTSIERTFFEDEICIYRLPRFTESSLTQMVGIPVEMWDNWHDSGEPLGATRRGDNCEPERVSEIGPGDRALRIVRPGKDPRAPGGIWLLVSGKDKVRTQILPDDDCDDAFLRSVVFGMATSPGAEWAYSRSRLIEDVAGLNDWFAFRSQKLTSDEA